MVLEAANSATMVFAKVLETANSGTMVFVKVLETRNSGTMVFAKVLEPGNSGTVVFAKVLETANSGTKVFVKVLEPGNSGTMVFAKVFGNSEFGDHGICEGFGATEAPGIRGVLRLYYKSRLSSHGSSGRPRRTTSVLQKSNPRRGCTRKIQNVRKRTAGALRHARSSQRVRQATQEYAKTHSGSAPTCTISAEGYIAKPTPA